MSTVLTSCFAINFGCGYFFFKVTAIFSCKNEQCDEHSQSWATTQKKTWAARM